MKSILLEWALWFEALVELSIVGKATILLGLAYLAAMAAARMKASVRHLILAASFGSLIVLPILTVFGPSQTIEMPAARRPVQAVIKQAGLAPPIARATAGEGIANNEPRSAGWSLPSWKMMLRLGWAAGLIALTVSLAVDLARLRRLRRDGLPCRELRGLVSDIAARSGVRRSVEVLRHEWVASPLTCGLRRPVILLPIDAGRWSEQDLARALTHEMEHIRRSDWAVQLAVRAISACYWFHPMVWAASRRMRLEAERACDDAVVLNAEPAAYADQLVSLAVRISHAPTGQAIGMAHRSDLSSRVNALLDQKQRRGRAGFATAAGAMCIAGLLAVILAPVRTAARSAGEAIVPTVDAGTDSPVQERRRRSKLDEALYEAAESGELAEIEQLIAAGANVNAALSGDGSPLIAAARKGRFEAVRLLLDRGADVNLGVTGDGNPLIMAARDGRLDIVRFLLSRGANVDQVVDGDENALIQASGAGRLEVVKLLVESGADVNAKVLAERSINNQAIEEWRSPLSQARRGNHQAVINYLLEAGARD
jgi:beta-lactamase regulating signal transducer with metallopeptidase domain